MLDSGFVSVWRRSIASKKCVPVKGKEIEGEQNLASRHFLERITALGIRRVSVRVAILLVPHLTFEYFMQTIRRCSYFMLASRKRFCTRSTYRGKVSYNSALYIDCRSQSLYVLLSKQTCMQTDFQSLVFLKCLLYISIRSIIVIS